MKSSEGKRGLGLSHIGAYYFSQKPDVFRLKNDAKTTLATKLNVFPFEALRFAGFPLQNGVKNHSSSKIERFSL